MRRSSHARYTLPQEPWPSFFTMRYRRDASTGSCSFSGNRKCSRSPLSCKRSISMPDRVPVVDEDVCVRLRDFDMPDTLAFVVDPFASNWDAGGAAAAAGGAADRALFSWRFATTGSLSVCLSSSCRTRRDVSSSTIGGPRFAKGSICCSAQKQHCELCSNLFRNSFADTDKLCYYEIKTQLQYN